VPVELLVLRADTPDTGRGVRGLPDLHEDEEEVRERFDDPIALFYRDVPPELAAEALRRGRRQSEAPMHEPFPLDAWPDVRTRVRLETYAAQRGVE